MVSCAISEEHLFIYLLIFATNNDTDNMDSWTQYNTAQYNTVQYKTIQYNTVQDNWLGHHNS